MRERETNGDVFIAVAMKPSLKLRRKVNMIYDKSNCSHHRSWNEPTINSAFMKWLALVVEHFQLEETKS